MIDKLSIVALQPGCVASIDDFYVLFYGSIFYLVSLVMMFKLMKAKMNKWFKIGCEAMHRIECEKCPLLLQDQGTTFPTRYASRGPAHPNNEAVGE